MRSAPSHIIDNVATARVFGGAVPPTLQPLSYTGREVVAFVATMLRQRPVICGHHQSDWPR